MSELFLLIAGIACLIWFKDSFKTASKSMEESSKLYYEKTLFETSQKRQQLYEEVEKDLKDKGIESYPSHRSLLHLINPDEKYEP